MKTRHESDFQGHMCTINTVVFYYYYYYYYYYYKYVGLCIIRVSFRVVSKGSYTRACQMVRKLLANNS